MRGTSMNLARLAIAAPLLLAGKTLWGAEDAVAQTSVASCGQVVAGPGVLTGDLDCSATSADAVVFEQPGSLDLAGFTLTPSPTEWGVACLEKCRVFSSLPGGRIVDGGRAVSGERLEVEGITVEGGSIGIWGGRVRIEDVLIQDTAGLGARGDDKIELVASTILNAGYGCSGERISLDGSLVAQSDGFGVSGRVVKIKESTVSGNGESGVVSTINSNTKIKRNNSIKAVRSDIVGNGEHGISQASGVFIHSKAKLKDCLVEGNAGDGVHDPKRIVAVRSRFSSNGTNGIYIGRWSEKAKLVGVEVVDNALNGLLHDYAAPVNLTPVAIAKGSEVSGNGTSIDCGSLLPCADLDTPGLPFVDSTSACGSSHVYESGIPGSSWGVCLFD